MPYATAAQAIALYGTDYIAVACDRDNDGSLDTASFDKWLEVATRKINGYLLGRYNLPLATPPEYFQELCTDIAVYKAAATADVMTEIIKDRYEEAIDYLKMIACGKIKLETATDTTEAAHNTAAQVQTRTQLSITGDARQFRRDDARKLI